MSREEKMSISNDLDCTNATRGVWLVKVPKYLSTRWQRAGPKTEAGRLKISKGISGKPDIKFTVSDEIFNMKNPTEKTAIPKEHQFTISNISNQTLAVFSRPKGEHTDISDSKGSGLFLEGHVVQKGECCPLGDDRYMQLKRSARGCTIVILAEGGVTVPVTPPSANINVNPTASNILGAMKTRQTMILASQPVRQVKHLPKIVQTYKPISDHKHNIEFEQKKKAEGKKSREDKDKVMDMLFAAFESHQYYNIKDLEKITRQPITYLKEILNEICNYNAKNPHRNMWELKPEYRHYKDNDLRS